jgi:hypothetical protein
VIIGVDPQTPLLPLHFDPARRYRSSRGLLRLNKKPGWPHAAVSVRMILGAVLIAAGTLHTPPAVAWNVASSAAVQQHRAMPRLANVRDAFGPLLANRRLIMGEVVE